MKHTLKKALALLISILMVASVLPIGVISVFADGTQEPAATKIEVTADEVNAWYDSAVDKVLTVDDAKDLLLFAKAIEANKGFAAYTVKITADIDLNPGWTAGKTAPANVWADTYDKGFKGNIDGQGHTISGLYKEATKQNFGFFGCVNGGSTVTSLVKVENLAIVNSCIYINYYTETVTSGALNCGAIFGSVWALDAEFKNLYVDVDFYQKKASTDGGRMGGIVGMVRNQTVGFDSCVFAGEINLGYKTQWSSGFVGYNNTASTSSTEPLNLSFTDCAFYGKILAHASCGTFAGRIVETIGDIRYTRCVSAGEAMSLKDGGIQAYGNGSAKTRLYFEDCYVTTITEQNAYTKYNFGSAVKLSSEDPVNVATNDVATTIAADAAFAGWKVGNGGLPVPAYLADNFDTSGVKGAKVEWYTNASTFEIDTAEKFVEMLTLIARGVNFSGKTIKLTKDIVFPENTVYHINLDRKLFHGTFDGGNHSVIGYKNDPINGYQGIFGWRGNATIKNVAFVECEIIGYNGWSGGIMGEMSNNTLTLENVYCDIDVIRDTTNYLHSSTDSKHYCHGGIVGKTFGSTKVYVTNSVIAGDVIAPDGEMTGGLIGKTADTASLIIANSAFYGALSGNGTKCGGFVGDLDGTSSIVASNAVLSPKTTSKVTHVVADVRTNATTSLTNVIYTDVFGTLSNDSATKVSVSDIKGVAAKETLGESFANWSPIVKGLVLPSVIADLIGAIEVVNLTDSTAFVAYQTSDVIDGKFDIRLIAIIDSLDYDAVGFKVTATGGANNRNNTTGEDGFAVTKAYESIISAGETYTAEELGGQYIITLVLRGFETTEGDVTFTVSTFNEVAGAAEVDSTTTFVIDTTKVA